MADEHSQTFPLAHFQGRQKSDEEFATFKTLRRERSSRCFVHIFSGFVILCAAALLFALIVLRVKPPTVQIRSVTLSYVGYTNSSSSSSSPSFNITLVAEIAVKNPNFGRFKYENSTASLLYGNTTVGERRIEEGRAKARKTEGMNVTVEARSNSLLDSKNLSSDLESGLLKLRSYAVLSGKVELMEFISKRKSSEMNCSMTLDLKNRQVHDLLCS